MTDEITKAHAQFRKDLTDNGYPEYVADFLYDRRPDELEEQYAHSPENFSYANVRAARTYPHLLDLIAEAQRHGYGDAEQG